MIDEMEEKYFNLSENFSCYIPKIFKNDRIIESYKKSIENIFEEYIGLANQVFQEYCYEFLKDNEDYIDIKNQTLIDTAYENDLNNGKNDICDYVKKHHIEKYMELLIRAVEDSSYILPVNVHNNGSIEEGEII